MELTFHYHEAGEVPWRGGVAATGSAFVELSDGTIVMAPRDMTGLALIRAGNRDCYVVRSSDAPRWVRLLCGRPELPRHTVLDKSELRRFLEPGHYVLVSASFFSR